jgi:hypothetical protein
MNSNIYLGGNKMFKQLLLISVFMGIFASTSSAQKLIFRGQIDPEIKKTFKQIWPKVVKTASNIGGEKYTVYLVNNKFGASIQIESTFDLNTYLNLTPSFRTFSQLKQVPLSAFAYSYSLAGIIYQNLVFNKSTSNIASLVNQIFYYAVIVDKKKVENSLFLSISHENFHFYFEGKAYFALKDADGEEIGDIDREYQSLILYPAKDFSGKKTVASYVYDLFGIKY